MEKNIDTNSLKSEYAFDNFVVGNNKFVYAVVQTVIENPGKTYSPLIIYGKTGNGKTHLLHAIENEIKKESTLNVKYITTEQFMEDAVNAWKNNEKNNYINQFKNIDLLLVDDFQFMSGKELIQKVFYEVCSLMKSSNKQVVIASDALQKKMDITSEIFKYYLDRGLCVEILESDYDTRLEILKRKAQEENFKIDDEYLEYIAQKFNKNNSTLISLLKRIVTLVSLVDSLWEIDYAFIDRNIKHYENAEHEEKEKCERINLKKGEGSNF